MGKYNARKTHCQHGHEFTQENTYVYPRTGRRACRICLRAHTRKRALTHPEEKQRRDEKYYQDNGQKVRESAATYYETNKERVLTLHRIRELSRYGLTEEQYDHLLERQDGRCAICGDLPEKSARRFAVDHNHEAGTVRGLLCSRCNTGLGLFRDDEEVLGKAITYLASPWASNPTAQGGTSM